MNFITRIFTALSVIATVVVGELTIAAGSGISEDFKTKVYITGTALIVLSLFLAVSYEWLSKVGHYLSFRLEKKYSDFIYNSINVRLEYLKDNGSLVAWERSDHITKLSLRRSKRRVIIPVEIEGKILTKSVRGINSSWNFPTEKTLNFQCYFDEKNILNREHVSSYAFQMKNSFPNKKEYWIMKFEKYCRRYRCDIFLPSKRKLKTASVLRREISIKNYIITSILHEGISAPWVKVEEPLLIIKRRTNHIILTLLITGLKPNDMYKIEWEFL